METRTGAGAFSLRGADAAFEPFEGDTSVHWLRREGDGDRQYQGGIWRATTAQLPEPFEHEFPHDETLYLISGSMRIEIEGGETLELVAGDAASFNRGVKVRWTILSDVEEFFFYS
jgi:uncharacterized cupin superfamily protein